MCIMAGNISPGIHMWDLRLMHLSSYLYVSPEVMYIQVLLLEIKC